MYAKFCILSAKCWVLHLGDRCEIAVRTVEMNTRNLFSKVKAAVIRNLKAWPAFNVLASALKQTRFEHDM